MDDIREPIRETEPIEEQSIVDETEPSIIEKPKKPRKKRETQSPAQLETLKRGREKLAEKRQKQVEAKKQAPMDDMMKTFEKKHNERLQSLEQQVPETKVIPMNIPELNDTKHQCHRKYKGFMFKQLFCVVLILILILPTNIYISIFVSFS